jgi:OFA family oxalate/formate antiporter-like MFS transporter
LLYKYTKEDFFMSNEKVMNRWLVVVGAILIQLALGAIYAWSVFTKPLVDAGWTKVQTQIVFALGLAFFAIVMVFAGKKLNSWGPRTLAIAGGLVLGAGYLLAGLVGGTNFTALAILIGVVGGSGIGLGYVVPIAVGMRWFPDKKGMITGLAVAGFGFGAMGWVKLAGEWGNLIRDMGLSNTFTMYGIAFAAMVVIGGFVMVFPPDGWKPEGWAGETGAGGAAASSVNFESGEMLRTPQFYMIWLTFLFGASAGLMSIGLMKLYPMQALQANGLDEASASAVAGTAMAVFFSLANGLGRIGWGMLSDKLGRKPSIVIMSAVQGVTVLAFTFMAGTPALLYIGATLIGFNFGGNFALFPAITADTFGTKNVGNNYPFVFLSYGVGGIVGPIMGGVLGDMGNFPLAFTICGVACLVGAVLTGMVKKPSRA